MNMMQSPPPAAGRRPDVARASLASAARHLWPYIWPRSRGDLKLRIFAAFVMMIAAKFANLAVPYAFKWATDALAAPGALARADWPTLLAGPIALTLLYAAPAHRDGAVHAIARRALRRRRDECGSAPRERRVRAYA